MPVQESLALPSEPILNGFSQFDLGQSLLYRLQREGISEPTPVQEQTIPLTMGGRDLIGIAQTGTGKTLAFALPVLHRLAEGQMALILAPTRELAEQISDTFCKLGRKPVLIIGGGDMRKQIRDLRLEPDIVVATPGRLLDHIDRRTVKLDCVSIVVLDEADRMLDLGFAPAVKSILTITPRQRQTMLFSATFPQSIGELAERYLVEPAKITIQSQESSPELIDQELIYVEQADKLEMLADLLDEHRGSVLVFSRTRHGARKLAVAARRLGHTAAEMHSDRTLAQRREALRGFKTGEHRILVATDIAARGIDVKDINLVLNYDLPDNPEDYIHRIGRTGRAGAKGCAITLATPQQHRDVKGIEKVAKKQIPLSGLSLEAPLAGSKSVTVLGRGRSRSRNRSRDRQPTRVA